LSIPAGIGLLIFGDPFWRGKGLQALAWSGIDAVISFSGSVPLTIGGTRSRTGRRW